jgi:hypothetical protein
MAMTKEKSGRDGEPVPAEEPEAADREIRPEKPGKPEISDLTEQNGTDETDVTDATDAASPAGDEAGQGEDKLKQELDASLAEAEILRKRLAEAQRRETQRSRTEAVRRYFEDEGLPEEAVRIALYCVREELSSADPEKGFATDEAGDLTADAHAALSRLTETTLAPLKELKKLKELRDGNGKTEPSSGSGISGVPVCMPPVNAGFGVRTKEEILSIRDGVERRRAIADNPGIFGIG